MNKLTNLDQYKNALLDASEKKAETVFKNIADRYEDDLLEFDDYPPEYFHFFLSLLSEKLFYKRPGLWAFILAVGTESHKLSTEHYQAISDCILTSYFDYDDETLCIAVCDFIARNYEYKIAEKLLFKLKEIEQCKEEKGFADDGLRILKNEKERLENGCS